jgi:hypothetical protein
MNARDPNWPPGQGKAQNRNAREDSFLSPEELAVIERVADGEPRRLSIDDPYFEETIPLAERKKYQAHIDSLETTWAEKEKNLGPGAYEAKKLSDAIEKTMVARVNEGVLGPNIRAQLTGKVDDIAGTDLYFEDIENPEPVGVSADITFGRDAINLQGKLLDIKTKLLDGGRFVNLTHYKPLGPQDPTRGGTIRLKIPKVILGLSRERAVRAVKEFGAGQPVRPESLMGLFMLYQTRLQLNHFIEYCEVHGTKKGGYTGKAMLEAVATYRKVLIQQDRLWQEQLKTLGIASLSAEKIQVLLDKDEFSTDLKKALHKVMPLESMRAAA